MRICKRNGQSVIEYICNGSSDDITLSMTNLVEEIILVVHANGLLDSLAKALR